MKATPTLEGCYAKLARAEEHIRQLDSANRRFLRKSTPAAEIGRDQATGRQRLITTNVKRPPVSHSIIVGDVLYNLRSCLDHLVHQLIVANTGKQPNYRTYEFPVFVTENKFEQNVDRLLRDVSADGVKRIKELQPFTFSSPNNTALFTLNEFGLVDKHRLPLLAVIRGRVSAMTAEDDNTSILWSGGGFDGPVQDGAVLAVFDKRVPPTMKLNAIAAFDVSLADGPPDLPASQLLGMIWRVVKQVVDHVGVAVDPAGLEALKKAYAKAAAKRRPKPRKRPNKKKKS